MRAYVATLNYAAVTLASHWTQSRSLGTLGDNEITVSRESNLYWIILIPSPGVRVWPSKTSCLAHVIKIITRHLSFCIKLESFIPAPALDDYAAIDLTVLRTDRQFTGVWLKLNFCLESSVFVGLKEL